MTDLTKLACYIVRKRLEKRAAGGIPIPKVVPITPIKPIPKLPWLKDKKPDAPKKVKDTPNVTPKASLMAKITARNMGADYRDLQSKPGKAAFAILSQLAKPKPVMRLPNPLDERL